MKLVKHAAFLIVVLFSLLTCRRAPESASEYSPALLQQKIDEYEKMQLSVDLSRLSSSDKRVVELLIEAAKVVDQIFWIQSYGNAFSLDVDDTTSCTLATLNYGPWERLNDNKPFIAGVGAKPLGANFYPADMTKDEFEALADGKKRSSYTMLRRDTAGNLIVIPYHQYFKKELAPAVRYLRQAASATSNPQLKKYLNMRADAFLNDGYYASDVAWLNLTNSHIDCVIGPVGVNEDALYGYKFAHAALVLIKDEESTRKIDRFASTIKRMKFEVPVEARYLENFWNRVAKMQNSQLDASVGVYDMLYCAGAYNTGNKLFGFNLPVEERMNAEKSTRKLLVKNVMREKFDKIMFPIAELLIDANQLEHVKFDAFLEYIMYREISQGLSPTHIIDAKVTVRESLKETYTIIGSTLCDVGALYIQYQLDKMGLCNPEELEDTYVTFLAHLLRAMRLGTSNVYGTSSMLIFTYLFERGAITRTDTGTYGIDVEKMNHALISLFSEVIPLYSGGDYASALTWLTARGRIGEPLNSDLKKLKKVRIPREVAFEQGTKMLGLK